MKVTKRQLAARFIDMLATAPLKESAEAVVQVAASAGYDADDLHQLVTAVMQELETRYGVAEVAVTTAHELPTDTLKAVIASVAKAAGVKASNYHHAINPELLGGYEARAGSVVVRDSVRDRLAQLGAEHG